MAGQIVGQGVRVGQWHALQTLETRCLPMGKAACIFPNKGAGCFFELPYYWRSLHGVAPPYPCFVAGCSL